MNRWIGVAALGLTLALPASAQDMDKLGWMTGNWIQKTAKEEVQENWLGPRGNVMVAINLTSAAGRGSSFEFLRIAVKDGRIVYFASPGGRPPVEFPLVQLTDNAVAFENSTHAYPMRISYRRDGEALIARIEGKRQGNDASEEWRFTRAP
jgi:Domain of unknown function (DUF6265)